MSTHLSNSITEPDLKKGLLSLIRSSITNTPWTPPRTSSPLVQATFDSQLALGNKFVMDGLLSPLWSSTQLAHYIDLGRRSSGLTWASKLIRLIWQVAWDMWMHRRRIKDSVDDCALPGLHLTLDTAIATAYTSYQTSPDHTLARWFSRNIQDIYCESLDWKTRWLEMVSSATRLD
jgi:hypothetical protein